MALTQYTYAEYDADWFATFFARCEKTGLGLIALSLTNYDTTSLPAIASGSVVEVNGAVGRAASEQAISGSVSSGVLNYIYIDASTWVPTWTVSVPAWDTVKQGWYSGNNRYVGGCYYDGSNYKPKFVYGSHRESGLRTRYWSRAGHSIHILNYLNIDTSRVENQTGSDGYGYIPVYLPDMSRVTAISAYMGGNNLNASTVILRYKDTNDTTWTDSDLTLSRTTGVTAIESDTGSLIIDNQNYDYEIGITLRYTYSGYYAHVYNVHLTYEAYRN